MRFKSNKYKEWVKSQPCCMCGQPGPSNPHHIKGVGGMSGVGLKAPDSMLMPLCYTDHRRMHENSEQWPMQWRYVVETLRDAIDQGIFVEG